IRWHRAGFNLDLDVGFTQEKEARQTANSKRSAGSNLSYGGREPDVGSAKDSWRVEDARLRGLRANRAALDAEGPAESGAGKTMGGISQQPPRGDCCDGLLHRADTHVWCTLLLLCHCP